MLQMPFTRLLWTADSKSCIYWLNQSACEHKANGWHDNYIDLAKHQTGAPNNIKHNSTYSKNNNNTTMMVMIKMMWTAEIQFLHEDMIAAVVIATWAIAN